MNLRFAKPMILATKVLENALLDARFFRASGMSLWSKIRFIVLKYVAIAFNRRSVNYLGRAFAYDNRFTPALLQGYSEEIELLDRFLPWSRIGGRARPWRR